MRRNKLLRKIKELLNEFTRFKYRENYKLCKQYPFLKDRDWKGTFLGYKVTWYDFIPEGWQKAFGMQLVHELSLSFDSKKEMRRLKIIDVKEKYGTLRINCNYLTPKVDYVIEKYEYLSSGYCINCGKPARYITEGWLTYVCEDCFNKQLKASNKLDEEHKRKRCAIKNIIKKEPSITISKRPSRDIPYKEIHLNQSLMPLFQIKITDLYNIDLMHIWGIK